LPWWLSYPWPSTYFQHALRRLYNDWIDFWFSAATPTTLNYFSEGLCAPLPFLEEWVNFHALQYFPGDFYLNAYNVTDDSVDQFDKRTLTPLHFRAALASPFIYPPVAIGDKLYYEGADRKPLPYDNFKKEKIQNFGDITFIAIMDILGTLGKTLVRRPQNLWDAYLISIVTPIVSLAKRDLEGFRGFLRIADGRNEKLRHECFDFRIPPDYAPYLLDWNHSNLCRLWDLGYEAGERFLADFKYCLPLRPGVPPPPPAPRPVRR
jgi:hypothetical protein